MCELVKVYRIEYAMHLNKRSEHTLGGLPVVTSYPSLSTISSISVGRVLSFHDLSGDGILPPKTKKL